MNKVEFEKIRSAASARVARLREIEAARVLELHRARLLKRADDEREAKAQGITLPPDDELARLAQSIGNWPKGEAP